MLRSTIITHLFLSAFCGSLVYGDQSGDLSENIQEDVLGLAETHDTWTPSLQAPMLDVIALPEESKVAPVSSMQEVRAQEVVFAPFTGKVHGKKVRLRLHPDVDSPIVQELLKGDLLAVVGDAGEFWKVEAPSSLKAYIFRSFVLDGVVEGNRVNVRLQPHLEAPVIAHLNAGDSVADGKICPSQHKWMEFAMPKHVCFYICKDFVDNIGSPDVKIIQERRLSEACEHLAKAHALVEQEMQKSYPHIEFDKISANYQTIIQEYSDFPELVEQAKEAFASMQEQFVDKRISYLETRTHDERHAVHPIEQAPLTEKMALWEPIEEALYLTWFTTHDGRNMDEYYEEQKMTTTKISGTLEIYAAPVKCKPGSYIVRQQDLPVAYVYSTQVDLDAYLGKSVILVGSPRPNNNFAFPAYFIFSVEP